jgi:cyclohexa-1,5-dienecarbonyl-CoA hydratase
VHATFAFLRVISTVDVVTIVLDHPPLNILTIEMMRELESALNEVTTSKHVKAVVLRAEGKAFCAGVDVADHAPEQVDEMIRGFGRLFTCLRSLPVPTIAVVQGAALGGGAELAIGCDIVLAGSSARFGQPEIRLGVLPPIAAAYLPQVVGYQQAAKLLFTGAAISSADAVRLHLVTEMAPEEQLDARLETLLDQLQRVSAATLRLTKRALLIGADRGGAAGLESIETLYLTDLMATADVIEGITAFVEKRQPVWRDE